MTTVSRREAPEATRIEWTVASVGRRQPGSDWVGESEGLTDGSGEGLGEEPRGHRKAKVAQLLP